MNRDDFEKLFQSADNRIYDEYRRGLYLMQEHPSLFYLLVFLAVCGVVGLIRVIL